MDTKQKTILKEICKGLPPDKISLLVSYFETRLDDTIERLSLENRKGEEGSDSIKNDLIGASNELSDIIKSLINTSVDCFLNTNNNK